MINEESDSSSPPYSDDKGETETETVSYDQPLSLNVQESVRPITKESRRKTSGDYAGSLLYKTSHRSGAICIFFCDDMRSFVNWKLEAGSGQKKGQIKETVIDSQINGMALEITGPHDGSVFMECPHVPDKSMCMDKPCVTILMRDMTGYSSVEFTVVDTLGITRKIIARNFRSQCVVGELVCEIPMRLNPTWNYAFINLDEVLENAYGTSMVILERLKLNANMRVKRVYFSLEYLAYAQLPLEFCITLNLTPEEQQELANFQDLEFTEHPTPVRRVPFPWTLPKLLLSQPAWDPKILPHQLAALLKPKSVEILEEPLDEIEEEKYVSALGSKEDLHKNNSKMLQSMLKKSIPATQMVMSAVSLYYPKSETGQDKLMERSSSSSTTVIQKSLGKAETGESKTCSGRANAKEKLEAVKICMKDEYFYMLDSPSEGEAQPEGSFVESAVVTDWERLKHGEQKIKAPGVKDKAGIQMDVDFPLEQGNGQYLPACKYNATDLAHFVRDREASGNYDLFKASVVDDSLAEEAIKQIGTEDFDESSLCFSNEDYEDLEERMAVIWGLDFEVSRKEEFQPEKNLMKQKYKTEAPGSLLEPPHSFSSSRRWSFMPPFMMKPASPATDAEKTASVTASEEMEEIFERSEEHNSTSESVAYEKSRKSTNRKSSMDESNRNKSGKVVDDDNKSYKSTRTAPETIQDQKSSKSDRTTAESIRDQKSSKNASNVGRTSQDRRESQTSKGSSKSKQRQNDKRSSQKSNI